jgi:hypothetical protein
MVASGGYRSSRAANPDTASESYEKSSLAPDANDC